MIKKIITHDCEGQSDFFKTKLQVTFGKSRIIQSETKRNMNSFRDYIRWIT